MRHYLNLFSIKRALSVALSVVIALMASDYFSSPLSYIWMLAAFLVTQTSRGTPIRQSAVFSVVLIMAILIAWSAIANISQPLIIDCLGAGVFVLLSFLSYLQSPQSKYRQLLWLYFPLMMLIVILSPQFPLSLMRDRLIEVAGGTVIGIIIGRLVFPVKFNHEFNENMVPVIRAMQHYLYLMTEMLIHKDSHSNQLKEQKLKIESILQSEATLYPEWVYEHGFNPGLRSGYRFFLVNIDRCIECIFSLNYFISQHVSFIHAENLDQPIICVLQQNQELLTMMVDYFEHNQLKASSSNFTQDMVDLEQSLQQLLPGSIELLDISPVYLVLTAIVRELRDLRGILLRLMMALPAPAVLALTHEKP